MVRLVMVVTAGYILMFFSELFFFNEGPGFQAVKFVTENPAGLGSWLGEMTFWYATFAYIMLAVIGIFGVRSIWSLFLAGGLFGWLAEGLLVDVMYSDMPITISWPSLGWHMIVDVAVGWYFVRRVLRKNNLMYTALLAVGLGLFWGVWATWFWIEEDMRVGAGEFAAFAMFFGGLCIVAYLLQEKLGGKGFVPSIAEVVLLVLWFVYLFVMSSVPLAGVKAVVLPVLAAVVLISLYWNKPRGGAGERRGDVFSELAGAVGWGHYVLLLLMPIVASGVYAFIFLSGIQIPIAQMLVPVLTYGGFVLFALSIVKVFFRSRRAE